MDFHKFFIRHREFNGSDESFETIDRKDKDDIFEDKQDELTYI